MMMNVGLFIFFYFFFNRFDVFFMFVTVFVRNRRLRGYSIAVTASGSIEISLSVWPEDGWRILFFFMAVLG